MKIIKNNYNCDCNNERECTCPNCNSVFSFNVNDIIKDEYNDEYLKCPCCYSEYILSEYYFEEPTLENITYPNDFYQYGNKIDSVCLNDKEINKKIKDCICKIKSNPDTTYVYIGTGDSFIVVFNHEDEYYFVVAKNFEDCIITKT